MDGHLGSLSVLNQTSISHATKNAHMVGHSIGQNHQCRNLPFGFFIKKPETGLNSSPKVGDIFGRHALDFLFGGPLVAGSHGCKTLNDLFDLSMLCLSDAVDARCS
jgi:hypothetical protein